MNGHVTGSPEKAWLQLGAPTAVLELEVGSGGRNRTSHVVGLEGRHFNTGHCEEFSRGYRMEEKFRWR
jgi:hypothetical protein